MKNLNSIDCLKLVMAYAVIAIHAAAICGATWPSMMEWFIRQAVPFFFITSGYLLSRKSSDMDGRERSAVYRRQSLKLLRLYGKWLLVYLPIAVYYFIWVNPRPIEREVVQYFVGIVVDGESPYAWPLWFIYSMAIVLFLLSLMRRINHPAAIGFVVFAVIYIINSIDSSASILKIFDRLTVRTLGGGMYICGGMLLYRVRNYLMRRPLLCGLLGAASIGLFYLKMPLSPLLGGMGLFCSGLIVRLGDSAAYQRIRAASMWVYYIHMIILFPLIILKNHSGLVFNPYLVLAGGICVSTLSALVLIALSKQRGFKWLAALVS